MKSTTSALAVVFGTGPVGIATVEALLARGATVRVVNRSGRLPVALEKRGVEARACDLLKPEEVTQAAAGAGTIFHCANPLYHQWASFHPRALANLVGAAMEDGALLAMADNLYMYARDGRPITEATAEAPPTRKGRIRHELTQTLRVAAEEKGLKWTAIRASDYYGPWSGGQSVFGTERFLDPLANGKRPALLGNADRLHSYTFVGDFGEALVRAASIPDAWGKAWICPNAPARTTREIASLFARAFASTFSRNKEIAGIESFGRIPKTMIQALGLFDPVIRELVEMLYQKEEDYIAVGASFTALTGMAATPLDEGIRKTVSWYRSL